MNPLPANSLPFATVRREEQMRQQGLCAARLAYYIEHGQRHPACRPELEPHLRKLRQRMAEVSGTHYPFSIN